MIPIKSPNTYDLNTNHVAQKLINHRISSEACHPTATTIPTPNRPSVNLKLFLRLPLMLKCRPIIDVEILQVPISSYAKYRSLVKCKIQEYMPLAQTDISLTLQSECRYWTPPLGAKP